MPTRGPGLLAPAEAARVQRLYRPSGGPVMTTLPVLRDGTDLRLDPMLAVTAILAGTK